MKKTRIVNINIIFIIIVVFIFACIAFKLFYVGLGNVKVNQNGNVMSLSDYAKGRNTAKETIVARRGTIYSSNEEVLAKDVNSYTVIAYLRESRTTNPANPQHVIDKEKTAKTLSPLINMTEKDILKLLNTKSEFCNDGVCEEDYLYQIELGPGGRGITELLKDQIDALGLPGIDFKPSTKRYYPNGEFMSYALGYAKSNKEDIFVGEMGTEQYFNDELSGKNGYVEYQRDKDGYQMTESPTVETPAVAGNDIYLTINTNIQMFVEQAMDILEKGKPEWATLVAVEAKTGKILGVASSPSFNNNTLNIKSYYDPFISYAYEPGSVMKIFSFMAAMENGVYNGSSKYRSGKLKISDVTIKDWNNYGWGRITYDDGFMASSNVAASKLALKMGRAKLKDFYTSLGFGAETGITLPNESKGSTNFLYDAEVAAASFGQNVAVNASQMIQALTAVANDGMILKPYLVEKIVNPTTGEVIKEYGREEIRKVASSETIEYITELMRGVVNHGSTISTGSAYRIKKYDILGKTGTAEIASTKGGYISGAYVKSFAGIFPGNDPQVIVYAVASKMKNTNYLPKAVKSLVKDVGTYLNINTTVKSTSSTVTLDSYINSKTADIKKALEDNDMEVVVIGEGDTIINQYPEKDTILNLGSKVFLHTNSTEYKMPNIKDWTRSEVSTYCDFINLKVTFDGYGYVTNSSINSGTTIKEDDELEVILKNKYEEVSSSKKK